ncbi:MAG TPA: MBL fold metallo-hydrolase [Syntrophomonas sp.]|nr:MBL fold metallo-hydrolase [Syntrophomonas sp.]
MSDKDLTNSGIMYADSGFFVIRQIMPYPLGETNVFLTESTDGWSVIDVGVDIDSTRRTWEQAVKEIGISLKQIKHIYITHCHPDHLGAARWLQQCCDAPVYMLREEIKRARQYIFLDQANFRELYRQAIIKEIIENKFPADKFEELIEDWYAEVRPLYLEPAEILPLDVGDKIDLGGNSFKVMSAIGHSDGQCMFWSEQCKQLFVADVMTTSGYLHFTDWPNTSQQNPLGNLFNLFAQLKAMEIERTFPGHGPIITDLNYQIDKLIAKHHKVLDKIQSAVTSPISAGELYPQLYNLPDYVHGHRVTIGETLGYLNYLVSKGRLNMINENGYNIYHSV